MQNLIVYQFNTLYEILKEIDQNLNFKIIEAKNEKSLNNGINISKKYLIVTSKKNLDLDNQIIFEKFPIKINKLIEKINVQFLKKQFNDQSKYYVKDYIIDLNARSIFYKNKKLKLTEKEIDTIMYLSETKKTTSIQELQKRSVKLRRDRYRFGRNKIIRERERNLSYCWNAFHSKTSKWTSLYIFF